MVGEWVGAAAWGDTGLFTGFASRGWAFLALLGTGAVGCADGGSRAPQTPGARLALAVAPLNLPGIGQACYDLRVTNLPDALGDLVWQRGDPGASAGNLTAALAEGAICSGPFGNGPGGDIAYVGACDAGVGSPPHLNTVTVWIENLYAANGSQLDPGSWENPCATGGAAPGCAQAFACSENEDTAVTFNFTVMRSADQGFFDVAITFENVFCSAKMDCSYDRNHNGNVDPGEEMNLLYNGPHRDTTAVLGFACTAGPSANDTTTLHVSDVRVRCGGQGGGATLQRAAIAPSFCSEDGTFFGAAFGPLREAVNGMAAGEYGITGVRYVPDAAAPGGYAPEPLSLPQGGTWGLGSSSFEGSMPLLLMGKDGAGRPRVLSLLVEETHSGATSVQDSVQSLRVGLAHIESGTHDDLVYDAIFDNAAGGVPFATTVIPVGDPGTTGGASPETWLVMIADLGGNGPRDTPAQAIDAGPIFRYLDGGSIGTAPSLVPTKLGDLGHGDCHPDLIVGNLTAGSCPTATGRANALWPLGHLDSGGKVLAVQLPDVVLPSPTLGTATFGTAGGVIAIPDPTTIIAQNAYIYTPPGGPSETRQTVTVYRLTAGAWHASPTIAATHLQVAADFQLPTGIAWNDEVNGHGAGYLFGSFLVPQSGGGVETIALIAAPTTTGTWADTLESWSHVSVSGGSPEPIFWTDQIVPLRDAQAPHDFHIFATGTAGQTGGGERPVIMQLPAAGTHTLAARAMPVPAVMQGRHFYFADGGRRFVGPTGEEKVMLLGKLQPDSDQEEPAVAWPIAYDSNASPALRLGNARFIASTVHDPLEPDDRLGMRSLDTYGFWWDPHAGPNGQGGYVNIRGTKFDHHYESSTFLCDAFLASYDRRDNQGGQGGPSANTFYAFTLDWSIPGSSTLTNVDPWATPGWHQDAVPQAKRELSPETSAPSGRIYASAIGPAKPAPGMLQNGIFAAGVRYDPGAPTGVVLSDGAYPSDLFAVNLFLADSADGLFGIATLMDLQGASVMPFTRSRLAIVDAHAANGSVSVLEVLDPSGNDPLEQIAVIDDEMGAIVAQTRDVSADSIGPIDAWVPSQFHVYKPNGNFDFTAGGWSAMASNYPPGSSPDGFATKVSLAIPTCGTSCTGDACMACVVMDSFRGVVVGKCVPTVACDDAPGFFAWDLNGGLSSGAYAPTRLDAPADAEIDAYYDSGARPLATDTEEGGFLTQLGAAEHPVFMASYTFATPPGSGQTVPGKARAVVAWEKGTSGWNAPVVFSKGTAFTWMQMVEGYVFGQFWDAEGGSPYEHAMVFREPTVFSAAWTSWLRWGTVQGIGGSFSVANTIPGKNIVYGVNHTNFPNGTLFVAELSGTATDHQLEAAHYRALEGAVASGTNWRTAGFAVVRLGGAGVASAQPVAVVDLPGHPSSLVFWNLPVGGDLTNFTGNAASAAVVLLPNMPGETVTDLGNPTGPYRTMDLAFAPRDTLSTNFAVSVRASNDVNATVERFAVHSGLASMVNQGVLLPMPDGIQQPPAVATNTILALNGANGNQWDTDPDPGDTLFQYAVYHGDEELDCGGVSCNKRFFNVAIGFNAAVSDCVVYFDATASAEGEFQSGNPPGDVSFPAFHWEVPLTQTSGSGSTTVCGQNPVGGVGSGVQPRYMSPYGGGAGMTFCYQLGPGEAANHTVTDWCGGGGNYSGDGGGP